MVHLSRKAVAPDAGAWHPATSADRHLRTWLQIQTSLSIAIARQCPVDAPFRVSLLHEGAQRPILDEAPVIGAAPGERSHARDVLLHSGDTPLVYAHTVLRREYLRRPWHHLLGVGTRPLGSLLFAHPAIRPGPIYYRRLDARHPLWHRAHAQVAAMPGESPNTPTVRAELVEALCQSDLCFDRLSANGVVRRFPSTHLWARRATFELEGCPLLVTEVFLPGILTLPRPR